MQLDGSTFLITGGSSGLGAACAAKLAGGGAGVIVADLAPPRDEVPRELAARALFVQTDVTSEDDVRCAIAAGEERFGPLRGAVCCAGVLHAARVLGRDGPGSLEEFRRVVEVNLTGTFNTVRLAAEAISRGDQLTELSDLSSKDGERGVIVMTSSVAAFDGQIGQASYSASKGGVAALTLPLARELGRHGIRVVSIAPGAFETPMMQAAPEKVRQSLIDQTPFPARLGDPAEFAALVAHVFENRMLNGCVLRLDGGLRMGPR